MEIGPETEMIGSMVCDTEEEDMEINKESNVGSVDEELEKPVEDGINNADTDSILQEE